MPSAPGSGRTSPSLWCTQCWLGFGPWPGKCPSNAHICLSIHTGTPLSIDNAHDVSCVGVCAQQWQPVAARMRRAYSHRVRDGGENGIFKWGGNCHCTVWNRHIQLLLLFVSFMHNSEVCKERNRFSLNRQADPMKQQTADISTGKTCWLNRSCESILKKSYVGRVWAHDSSFNIKKWDQGQTLKLSAPFSLLNMWPFEFAVTWLLKWVKKHVFQFKVRGLANCFTYQIRSTSHLLTVILSWLVYSRRGNRGTFAFKGVPLMANFKEW